MKTITNIALALTFMAIASSALAQGTVIKQSNDTLTIEIDGETKLTIISPEITKIIGYFEEDTVQNNSEEGSSDSRKVLINFDEDEDIIVKEQKNITVVKTIDTDSDEPCKQSKKQTKEPEVFEGFLNIDWGMNNYLNSGRFPDSYNAPYTVKPWGSWSFGIGPGLRIHVGDNISLNLTAQVMWYNFKFQEKSTRIERNDDGLIFGTDDNIQFPLRSKLTAAYVNAEFLPMVHFGKDDDDFNKKMFRLGAGVYAGYRIDSYTKYVDEDLGRKNKLRYHNNYYLENFRYGVKAVFGVRDYNIFAAYDLNYLFTPGKGPELNAFSIGLNFTI